MRKLSDHQWRYVIDQVLIHCVNDQRYERHLFVLSMFFLLGLRISELSVNDRHHPVMGDFFKITNYDGGLKRWGRVINGAKLQADACVDALKRYQLHLGLQPFPSPGDAQPLVYKMAGSGGLQAGKYVI